MKQTLINVASLAAVVLALLAGIGISAGFVLLGVATDGPGQVQYDE